MALQIDDGERLVPVLDLVTQLTGRRPHPATAWRWANSGVCGGETLKVVLIGGMFHTTRSELIRFLNARTEAKLATNKRRQQPQDETPAVRSTAKDRKLRDAGLS